MLLKMIDNQELFISATGALQATNSKKLQVTPGHIQVISPGVIIKCRVEHDLPTGFYQTTRANKMVMELITIPTVELADTQLHFDVSGPGWGMETVKYSVSLIHLQHQLYNIAGIMPKTQYLKPIHYMRKGWDLNIFHSTGTGRVVIMSDGLNISLPEYVHADTCKKLVTAIPRVTFDELNNQVQSANSIINELLQQWYDRRSKQE